MAPGIAGARPGLPLAGTGDAPAGSAAGARGLGTRAGARGDAPAHPGPAACPDAIVAEGLGAQFPTGSSVGPLALRLRQGEDLLIVGPSGAGKSTLLQLLHGAVPHVVHAEVTGTVRTGGRDVAASTVAGMADAVGVVAQDPSSGVCLTEVEDEVAFPLENTAVPPGRIAPAISAALEHAGATGFRDRRTTQLSGGELQRIAIAAAVATSPRIVLLDEPTAMLDAAGVATVREALARRPAGASRVIVEHRLDELAGDDGLAALPTRWLVLDRHGRMRAEGPAERVVAEHARAMLADGCWLPADAELTALLGGPLADPAVQQGLLALARDPDPAPGLSRPPVVDARSASSPEPHSRSRPWRRRSGLAAPDAATLRADRVTIVHRTAERAPRPVLSDVDLELRPGEVTALVGANGAGKSSLLACLAGVRAPEQGSVVGPRAGLVFQNPEHQFVAHTVRDEIAFAPGATPERVDDLLERFALTELASRNPFRLSGGQKRRLSLAAMLADDRPFLLADEPCFGLDRHGAVWVLRSLRDEARHGRGVLLASHDLRAVLGYADRVIVLTGGAVAADAAPPALVRDPRLIEAAGIAVSPLVRWLAANASDDDAARIIRSLDSRTLALRPETPRAAE